MKQKNQTWNAARECFIQSLCCKLRNDVWALNSISANSLTDGASSAVCVSNIVPVQKRIKRAIHGDESKNKQTDKQKNNNRFFCR